jgi:hypothetical protein
VLGLGLGLGLGSGLGSGSGSGLGPGFGLGFGFGLGLGLARVARLGRSARMGLDERAQARRIRASHLAHFHPSTVDLEGRHGSDAARRGGLLVGVHVDLDERAPRELRRERLKVRPDHPAWPAPG